MKALFNSKKAQSGTLQALVVSLIVIGIVLGVGFMLYNEFSDTLGDTAGTNDGLNETVTLASLEAGGVFVDKNHTSVNCFNSFVVTNVENSTQFLTINIANISWNEDTGMVWNTSVIATNFSDGEVNLTYTYKYSDSEACSAIEDTIDATSTIPTWLTIIVILVIVGLLFFIVFKVLPQGGENSYESSGSKGGFFSSGSSSSAEM